MPEQEFSLGDIEAQTPKPKSAPKVEKSTTLTLPQIEKNIMNLIVVAGMAVGARGDKVCSQALIKGAENEAKALTNLAKQNPSIRRALESIAASEGWIQFAMATSAIVVPICQHHGITVSRDGFKKKPHTHEEEAPAVQVDKTVPPKAAPKQETAPVSTADWVEPTHEERPQNGVSERAFVG